MNDLKLISLLSSTVVQYHYSTVQQYDIQYRYSGYFVNNQFGFKKNLGCSDTIYIVRNVKEHFVSNGSTFNACALDVSKAFDRLNHYVLYHKPAQ